MMGDAGKTMLKLSEDLDNREAGGKTMATWEELEAKLDKALDKIEQLEAEVASWKNSYERVNRERAELAFRLQMDIDSLEREIERPTETPNGS